MYKVDYIILPFSGGIAAETMAHIVGDFAVHREREYIGDGKYDFLGVWVISHIATGFAYLIMDEMFGVTTTLKIAERINEMWAKYPKYEGRLGNSSDIDDWMRPYRDEMIEERKPYRFFERYSHFYFHHFWDGVGSHV